jgi:F420-non-reducing hydrogenase iron-sulfur subunit
MQYTTDVRIIRLMCTGRVDPTMVGDAFIEGADGLMVVGCHFGDCHYISGNYQAKVKVGLAVRTLEYVGLNPARVAFNQCSSAEGERFVNLVGAFDRSIRELGPLGSVEGLPLAELTERLATARTALDMQKLRWVVGKFTEFQGKGNKYGERFTEHEMWRTLDTIVMDEIATHDILKEMRKAPVSAGELAQRLGIAPPDALKYVLALQRRGLAELASVEGTTPLYRAKAPAAVEKAA